MKTVYVLVTNSEAALQGVRGTVYAVFGDKETAEKMKREGDEVAEVPYFEDKLDRSDWYTTSPNTIRAVPCSDHTTVTYQSVPWSKDSTLAPPPTNYPKVTCNKTVDEHSWTNRVD